MSSAVVFATCSLIDKLLSEVRVCVTDFSNVKQTLVNEEVRAGQIEVLFLTFGRDSDDKQICVYDIETLILISMRCNV